MVRSFLLTFVIVAPLLAAEPLRICLYAGNRGSNAVHRQILREAHAVHPRLFVIDGDVIKHDYGEWGEPEAVLEDYRREFGTPKNPLTLWPQGPGPAVFVIPGGYDEQFFLDLDLAEAADSSKSGRFPYEGTNELGVQLYQAFNLEDMRIRVQAIPDIEAPLPISPYGDYLLVVGSGSRRECALLMLYRTDRWGFRTDQIDWADSILTELRSVSPRLPLMVISHDWTWFFPDSLDDGMIDGALNGIRGSSPQLDRVQKQRLALLLQRSRADIALAADRHIYWAGIDSALLRINMAAGMCYDEDGRRVSLDNAWIEYAQDDTAMYVTAHIIEPPAGCGIHKEAAALGTVFQKTRTAGAVWRRINP